MCIIAIKNKGINMPSAETLETMFYNNPDGAGFMYAIDNKVYIRKGYMSFEEFNGAIDRLSSKYDIASLPLVMHFRIATSGNVDRGTTHPFPVSSKRKILRRLKYTSDLAVVHNGIIPISAPKGMSDTMKYTAQKLTVYKSIQKDFYKQKCYLKHIKKEIQSKMVFLDGTGYISMIGDFITENDGMIYSNKSYLKREYFYDKMLCCYSACMLCPVDGYVKYRSGEMADSADDFYLINKYGAVYRYDFIYDIAVPIDAEAYTYSGLPYVYDERNAVYFDVEG